MTDKKRKWLVIFGVLVPGAIILTIAVPLIFQSLQPLPPIPALPNPNGYNDLIQAGEMISADTANFDKMNPAELQKLVATNAKALALARVGLNNECRVTTQFTKTYMDLDHHFVELSGFKNLAHVLMAEGRLAELKNHPGDAAKFYLEAVHLGNESARGGILIDQMVGTATEAIGTRSLEKIAGSLDAKSCRETAATLETLDAQRQTWPEVMQQEHAWSLRTFNTLRDKISRQLVTRATEKAYEKPAQNFAGQQTKTRQLIVQLAARAYELDKGHRPANLTELVPDYLKAVPQDPSTGTNMVYSAQ
jgi:hypothetical protein